MAAVWEANSKLVIEREDVVLLRADRGFPSIERIFIILAERERFL